MATAAQIAANRANAQKSTGPKSEAGKARSAMNALKHGLCAEKLLIDEEEREAWEELRADYLARLRPEGPAKTRLAAQIAQVAWRRERDEPLFLAARAELIRRRCVARWRPAVLPSVFWPTAWAGRRWRASTVI